MLICIGVLTIYNLRGAHRAKEKKVSDFSQDKHFLEHSEEKSLPMNRNTILGSFYITMGLGIIFNFAIYFLIYCLDWLLDRYIFDFINFSGKIER